MAQPNEASVEEILESIKRVMARDSGMAEQRPAPAKEEPADILDLSEMELSEDQDENCEAAEDTPLTTEAVRAGMQENFAALAMLAEPGAKPQIVRSGETSLEGLVREMLRPMLAEWLDQNLPGMVEKMVQAEIARIAGKRK